MSALISRVLPLLVFIIFSILNGFTIELATARAENYAQSGWPGNLKNLFLKLNENPEKNYAILISRTPSHVVDFRTNNGIRNSINSKSFQETYHPGHAMFGWKCHIDNENYNSLVAFSGETLDQHKKMVDLGWGLNALLATYKDGYIQSPEILDSIINLFKNDPTKLIITVFEIQAHDCIKIINNYYDFDSDYKKAYENFSLYLRPEKGEGAGCGSFAIHLMSQIKELKSLTQNLNRIVKIPDYLLGTGTALPKGIEIPSALAAASINKTVSKYNLIAYDWENAKKTIDIKIVDPELVVFWQLNALNIYNNDTNNKQINIDKKFLSYRSLWQREQIQGHHSFINKKVVVNSEYDDKAQWIQNWNQSHLKNKIIEVTKAENFLALIIKNK